MSANLLIQTAFLGDLLLSVPLMKRLKKLYPEDKLLLVCRKGVGDFFKRSGLVDEVFEIKKGDAESYEKVLTELKNHSIRLLLAPHESWRTVFFSRRIQAQKKISFRKFLRGFFFDQLIEKPAKLPEALRQLSLLCEENAEIKAQIHEYSKNGKPYEVQEHGLLTAPPTWANASLRQDLIAQEEAFQQLCHKLSLEKINFSRSALLFPGSVWATKRWTEQGFVEAGKTLQQQGYQVIVMGGPGEELLSERVSVQIPGSLCLAGRTSIYESALITSRASLVIGNDSASSHMAAVCETPVVAIFGPTIIDFGYRPWSAQTYLVEYKDLACRPCSKHGPQKCPLGTHECMKHISANEVLEKAQSAVPGIRASVSP